MILTLAPLRADCCQPLVFPKFLKDLTRSFQAEADYWLIPIVKQPMPIIGAPLLGMIYIDLKLFRLGAYI